jgi:O-antigen/teichoic acid export membrane protein
MRKNSTVSNSKKTLSLMSIEKVLSKIINSSYFFIVAILVSKEELGLYSWVISISAFIIGILTGGIGKVISRRIAVDPKKFNNIVSHLLKFYFIISVLILVSAFFSIFFYGKDEQQFIILSSLFIISAIVLNVFRESFVGLEKFIENSKISIINITSKALIGLAGVFIFNENVSLLLFALVFSNIFSCLFYIKELKNLSFRLDENEFKLMKLKSIFKESLPLLGVILFDSALTRFDIFFMGMNLDMSTTGDYSYAYKVFEFFWIPFIIAGTYVFPKISKGCNKKVITESDENKIYVLMKALIQSSFILPFVICLFWTPVIDYLTNNMYGNKNQLILELLCMSIPFISIIGINWSLLMAKRKGKVILLITVITAILNIFLNIYLIQNFGSRGAAITNLISNIFQVSAYMFFVSKILKFTLKIYKNLIVSAILIFTLYYFTAYIVDSLFLKSLIIVLFISYSTYSLKSKYEQIYK